METKSQPEEPIILFDRKARKVGVLIPSLKVGEMNRSEKRHLEFSRMEKKRRRQEKIAKKRVANVI